MSQVHQFQTKLQGCIKFLISKFIKSIREEYQVVKRRKEYHSFGEEYKMKKRERGSNIIFSIIFRLLEEYKREKGKGTKINLKNEGGEDYQIARNFIHP